MECWWLQNTSGCGPEVALLRMLSARYEMLMMDLGMKGRTKRAAHVPTMAMKKVQGPRLGRSGVCLFRGRRRRRET